MHLNSAANRNRAGIFDRIQSAAADVLAVPALAATLGDHALALEGIVTYAYPLNVKHGNITVPKNQKANDNVGVLIADDQIGMTQGGLYFADVPAVEADRIDELVTTRDQAENITKLASHVFYGYMRRRSSWLTPHSGAQHKHLQMKTPPSLAAQTITVRSRNLVSVGTDVFEHPREIYGAAFVHEADHVLFARESVDTGFIEQHEDVKLMQTISERRAHYVNYLSLLHSGAIPDFPDAETIESKTFDELASTLARIARQPDNKYTYHSFLAWVVTMKFGNMAGLPTETETGLYAHFDLI